MLHRVLDPFFILMICLGILTGMLWLRRSIAPRLITLLTIAYSLLYVGCTPMAMYFALGSLEWQFNYDEPIPENRQAIVVLGGYVIPAPDDPTERILGDDSLHRCLAAMDVYRAGPKRPIVLSGGMMRLAETMATFLREHGLDPDAEIIVEDLAWNTHQNAKRTAPLLRERGIERIVLITDAYHMPRAERCFRVQGFDVTPYASQHRTERFELSIWSFVPSVWAAQDMNRVAHEWLGVAWYSLRGFI